MKQETANSQQRTVKVPVRGTQSFVGVMVEVWKKPSLTGIEIAWRWLVWVPLLAVLAVGFGKLNMGIQFHPELLSSLTVFKPVEAIASLDAFFSYLTPAVNQFTLWWMVVLLFAWAGAWTVGRARVMKRLEAGMTMQYGALFVLGVLRIASVLAVMLAWFAGCRLVFLEMILRPVSQREEPNLVLAFALIVTATLVLFVLWCLVSWVLQLAPILAMAQNKGAEDSLRDAMTAGPVRGKLIEINLVMGIVKVSLIVLALVFSACPLPFSNIETQEFLNWWWAGVALFYVVASDYFHVVRAAAYLRLWQAYKITPEAGRQ